MERKGMRKGGSGLIVMVGVLTVAIALGIFWFSGATNSNSAPATAPFATPGPTVSTTTTTPIPTCNPTATPTHGHTVTYLEQSRNQTIIVIQFKLEPNSYVFQINATTVHLIENGARISANTNDAVVIGTQYSTLYFPINDYNGTGYTLSSDALPPNAVWIKI